jgi:uncharacterized membrane protein
VETVVKMSHLVLTIDNALLGLTLAAALGSGVVGGIFYGFSSFIMAALQRLPKTQGAAAMKMINVTVINPIFLLVFLGTTLVCLLLAGGSLCYWDHPGAKLLLAASLFYLLGCFGVTMLGNVPLNNQLAVVVPDEEATLWAHYLKIWTRWNHVRTFASILASLLFMLALFWR